MKVSRFWLVAVLSFLAVVLAACSTGPNPTPTESRDTLAPVYGLDNPARIPGAYIVVFKGDQKNRSGLSAQALISSVSQMAGLSLQSTYSMEGFHGLAATIQDDTLEQLQKNPNVAFIEADSIVPAYQQPVFSDLWGLDRIDQRSLPLDNSYNDTGNTGKGVYVYVIDSGIRASHVEFGGRVIAGYSAINDGRGTTDCDGHGTHVAGTVGGETVGVAREVTLVPVRVLNCNGSGTKSQVVAGINWVTNNARFPAVANMSLGGPHSVAEEQAINASIAKGVVYVVAAGNENQNACNVGPAYIPGVITVAASTSDDRRASFSNYGSCVDIFAPGVSVYSAYKDSDTGYIFMSGTSMAAPHVAGIVARLRAPKDAERKLKSCATKGIIADAQSTNNHLLYLCYNGKYWGTGHRSTDLIGDFNGDGKDDVIQFSLTAGGNSYVWLSTGSGFTPWKVWGTGHTSSDKIGDFNGDGKDDVIQFSSTAGGNSYVWLSNGSGFGAWTVWGTGHTSADRLGDFNGDGKTDVIQLQNGNSYVWLSTGTGFTPWTVWGRGHTSADRLGDFNGDGKTDVIQLQNGNSYVWLSTGSSFAPWTVWGTGHTSPDKLGDFNGDGRTDLILLTTSLGGRSYVRLSQGNLFNSRKLWGTGHTSSDKLGDFNGDGRTDVIQLLNDNAYVWLSNGNSFGAWTVWSDEGHTLGDKLGDFDGDGKTDVIRFESGNSYVWLSSGSCFCK